MAGITDFSKFNQYIHYKYDFKKTDAPEDGPDVTKKRSEEGAFYKEYPTSFPTGRNLDKYDRTSSSDTCKIYCVEGASLVSGYIYPHSSYDTLENLSGQYLVPLNDSVLNRSLTKKQKIGQELGLTFEELQRQISTVGIRYWCSGTPTGWWVCPDGFYPIDRYEPQSHEAPVPGSGGWDSYIDRFHIKRSAPWGYMGNSCTSCKTEEGTPPFRVPTKSDVCLPDDFRALGIGLGGVKAQQVLVEDAAGDEDFATLNWTVGEVGVYDYDTFDLSFQGINGDSGVYPISGCYPEKPWHPKNNKAGKVIPSGMVVVQVKVSDGLYAKPLSVTIAPAWDAAVGDKGNVPREGDKILQTLSYLYDEDEVNNPDATPPDLVLYHNHTWTGGLKWNGGGSFSYIPKRPTHGIYDAEGSSPWDVEPELTNGWKMTDMCYATRHPHILDVHSLASFDEESGEWAVSKRDNGKRTWHIHDYRVAPRISHPSQYIIPPPKIVSIEKFNVYSGDAATRRSKQRRHAGANSNSPKNILDTPDLSKVDFSEAVDMSNGVPFNFSWINYGIDFIDHGSDDNPVLFESIESFEFLDEFNLYWAISAEVPFFGKQALEKPNKRWSGLVSDEKRRWMRNSSVANSLSPGGNSVWNLPYGNFALRAGNIGQNKAWKHPETKIYEKRDLLSGKMPESAKWPAGEWILNVDEDTDEITWHWRFYNYYLHVWYGYTFDDYRVYSSLNSQMFNIVETRDS